MSRKKQIKSVTLQIRMDAALRERLSAVAEKAHKVDSELVREATVAVLDAIEKANYRYVYPMEFIATHVPAENPILATLRKASSSAAQAI